MPTYRADINLEETSGRKKRARVAVGVLVGLFILAATLAAAGRSYLLDGLPKLPDKDTMWQLNLKQTMTLVDRNGNMLGHRGPWIGRPLKLDELPPHLPNAVLAIEDERFFQHEGVDNKAILRALVTNVSTGARSQGGSTLTQQLVKTMVLTPEKTYRRKFQEALLARDLEAVMSKPEILELYINRISLGPQIFGVEAASQRYFGKSARDLELSEAAMLAGLAQAPSRYNPTRNYDGALRRSQTVLNRMFANGFISDAQLTDAFANPPEIIDDVGVTLDANILGYAFDYVNDNARRIAGPKHSDLVVTVTLDPNLMKLGHDAINTVLDNVSEDRRVSQGALVTVENGTGAIRALIGGRDYQTTQFNRPVQAQRQPGSSFKTFVYAAALEEGFTPATVRVDQPINLNGWSPENYTLRYRGPMTLREALKLSINTIAAQVGSEIGPDRVAEAARRFGIQSELRAQLSLSLGSSEVNLMELTSAYSVFANQGRRHTPYIIEKIETSSGEVLYTHRDRPGQSVYPKSYARQMNSILHDTVESGTAYGAKLENHPAAGKTGTSQDYRDAWFIGFTNQMTTGVWMGNDNNSTMQRVTGGLFPADAWKIYMDGAHRGLAAEDLPLPDTQVEGQAERLVAFYGRLSGALRRERDLASGSSSSGQ